MTNVCAEWISLVHFCNTWWIWFISAGGGGGGSPLDPLPPSPLRSRNTLGATIPTLGEHLTHARHGDLAV